MTKSDTYLESAGRACLNELGWMNTLNIKILTANTIFVYKGMLTRWHSRAKNATNYQLFLGSISNRFEVKSCNCEKPSRFSSFPFCPLDDAISFVELSVDIFKLSVYYTHLNNIYGVLKMYIYPKFGIHKNSKYRNISSESYDSPDLRQSVVKT